MFFAAHYEGSLDTLVRSLHPLQPQTGQSFGAPAPVDEAPKGRLGGGFNRLDHFPKDRGENGTKCCNKNTTYFMVL